MFLCDTDKRAYSEYLGCGHNIKSFHILKSWIGESVCLGREIADKFNVSTVRRYSNLLYKIIGLWAIGTVLGEEPGIFHGSWEFSQSVFLGITNIMWCSENGSSVK